MMPRIIDPPRAPSEVSSFASAKSYQKGNVIQSVGLRPSLCYRVGKGFGFDDGTWDGF